MRINCHVPITLRIVGVPTDDQLAAVGQALTRAVAARLAEAERLLAERHSEPVDEVRERHDPARDTASGYVVTSYADAKPIVVPVRPKVTVSAGPKGGVARGFPAHMVVVEDEVALRSSPAGRRAGDRFHNLVASLRQGARVVALDATGNWLKVKVESGTVLDRTTNSPVDAAGLTGYVSAELLGPDADHDVKPTAESRQSWTAKALAAAGIDLAAWRPDWGFRRNEQTSLKVYQYYSSLYLADPRLRWAAMAKLAGGEVYRGYRTDILPSEDFGRDMLSVNRSNDLQLTDLIGGAYVLYVGSLDILLLRMQRAIFLDLGWQHQAYREGGIKAMAAAHDRGEITDEVYRAWQDIDSGVESRVNAGNVVLLRREQYEVLQGGSSGKGFYGQIQDLPDMNTIPEMMSENALSPIPGGKPFAGVVKGGDITTFKDRWEWLEKDMIPAFQRLDPATLRRLVEKPLPELAGRKF